MEEEVLHLSQLPFKYEKEEWIDKALCTLPMDQLYSEAEAAVAADHEKKYAFADHQIMAFLKWYKKWMHWTNNESCVRCGSSETTMHSVAPSTDEERRYGAGSAEIFQCEKCAAFTRFPRYNDPLKLIETRKGRCGEWCNLAMLFLRCLGLDVRYIWNAEDHVWLEVWSEHLQRWCHVDSCEAAYDQPLIYTDGWGKKMSYCVAFSIGGCRDVTRRYVRRQDMQLPRDQMDENRLASLLGLFTSVCRRSMSPVDQVTWSERDHSESRELESYRIATTVDSTAKPRQSGSKEWTASRGEDGTR